MWDYRINTKQIIRVLIRYHIYACSCEHTSLHPARRILRGHPKTKIRKCGLIGQRKNDSGILDALSQMRLLSQTVCAASSATQYVEPSYNKNKGMWDYRIKKKQFGILIRFHTHACSCEQTTPHPAHRIMRALIKKQKTTSEILAPRKKR